MERGGGEKITEITVNSFLNRILPDMIQQLDNSLSLELKLENKMENKMGAPHWHSFQDN